MPLEENDWEYITNTGYEPCSEFEDESDDYYWDSDDDLIDDESELYDDEWDTDSDLIDDDEFWDSDTDTDIYDDDEDLID